jgi:hypothetical protein
MCASAFMVFFNAWSITITYTLQYLVLAAGAGSISDAPITMSITYFLWSGRLQSSRCEYPSHVVQCYLVAHWYYTLDERTSGNSKSSSWRRGWWHCEYGNWYPDHNVYWWLTSIVSVSVVVMVGWCQNLFGDSGRLNMACSLHPHTPTLDNIGCGLSDPFW